jgi:hypothetical protein
LIWITYAILSPSACAKSKPLFHEVYAISIGINFWTIFHVTSPRWVEQNLFIIENATRNTLIAVNNRKIVDKIRVKLLKTRLENVLLIVNRDFGEINSSCFFVIIDGVLPSSWKWLMWDNSSQLLAFLSAWEKRMIFIHFLCWRKLSSQYHGIR